MTFEKYLDLIKSGETIKNLADYLENFYKSDWDLRTIRRICENYRGSKTYYVIMRNTSEIFRARVKRDQK